jgi:hypothetical protein
MEVGRTRDHRGPQTLTLNFPVTGVQKRNVRERRAVKRRALSNTPHAPARPDGVDFFGGWAVGFEISRAKPRLEAAVERRSAQGIVVAADAALEEVRDDFVGELGAVLGKR